MAVTNKKLKKIKAIIKLNIPAGAANPSPPVGPALGQHGLAIMDFCKEFNARTQPQAGQIIPVVITAFEDRTFTFVTKTPVSTNLIMKALGIKKGSGVPNKTKVGKLSQSQLETIATTKLPDLNASALDKAKKIIAGTARSMGVDIEK